jgi:hypothetical protein
MDFAKVSLKHKLINLTSFVDILNLMRIIGWKPPVGSCSTTNSGFLIQEDAFCFHTVVDSYISQGSRKNVSVIP